jgi:rhodanese-related sulfurtransferase
MSPIIFLADSISRCSYVVCDGELAYVIDPIGLPSQYVLDLLRIRLKLAGIILTSNENTTFESAIGIKTYCDVPLYGNPNAFERNLEVYNPGLIKGNTMELTFYNVNINHAVVCQNEYNGSSRLFCSSLHAIKALQKDIMRYPKNTFREIYLSFPLISGNPSEPEITFRIRESEILSESATSPHIEQTNDTPLIQYVELLNLTEAIKLNKKGVILVDTRHPESYLRGHLIGSINLYKSHSLKQAAYAIFKNPAILICDEMNELSSFLEFYELNSPLTTVAQISKKLLHIPHFSRTSTLLVANDIYPPGIYENKFQQIPFDLAKLDLINRIETEESFTMPTGDLSVDSFFSSLLTEY